MRPNVVSQTGATKWFSGRNSIRLYILMLFILLSFSLFAETFTAQGFEAGTSDTWYYTANPPDMLRYALWGRTDQPFGSATAQAGSWYWLSWDLNNVESSLTFDTVNLPVGYVYTLSFYYFTNGLNPASEFCKYSVAYDSGSVWSDWTTLSTDTDAWTLVTISIPAYASNVRLKVAASHDGTGKYAHWDSFCINRSIAPPTAPIVYNTTVAQRTDGSGLVDIYYDLFDVNGDNSSISLLLSDNAGTSYSITPNPANLSGDVGAGILPASGKHIVWNSAAEIGDFDNNQYKLRLVADDNTNPTVATPTFTPGAGVFTDTQNISISCATTGAIIHYTLDGTEPTESSAVFSTPILVSTNTTVKAKAYMAQWTVSTIASSIYTINALILVNGGTLTMGRTVGSGESDELPTHTVSLSSFYMSKYEITQDEFQKTMGYNPSTYNSIGANYPVYFVSWYAVVKYCNLRSINEGLGPVYTIGGSTNPANWGTVPITNDATWNAAICNWSASGYRLPTEAEWEYAARGGTSTPDYLYTGSDNIANVAWYSGNNTPSGSKQVGTKSPNALNIYDMSGNVWEWCWDWHGSYSSGNQGNPTGAASGLNRVLRGGAYYNVSNSCRVSNRYGNYDSPSQIDHGIGFRVCRTYNSFVYITSGTYTMGDTHGIGSTDELPTHSVNLNSYYISKYEVTQGEYQSIMGSNPAIGFGVGTNYPVYYVSWYSVLKYCNLRSMNEGLTPVYTISGSTNPSNWGTVPVTSNPTWDAVICNWSVNGYRLPTEAEWEYAARGVSITPDYQYSGSDDINLVAWYNSNSPSTTQVGGTKSPNAIGIYDMSGNVFEWCWDWYGSYNSSPQSNPKGPVSGLYHVRRGGAFELSAVNSRVTSRELVNSYDSGHSVEYIGFRLCRSIN